MSQHDWDVENASGLLVRQNINSAINALATNSSGNDEPPNPVAFMFWVDTSGSYPILKQRNAANNAWLSRGRLDLDNGFGSGGFFIGDSAPSSPYAFQQWIDTTGSTAIYKIRNEANDAWISIGDISVANMGMLLKSGGTMSGPIAFSTSSHTFLPSGTTAQRPGSPTAGMVRFNTDLVAYEGYNGSAWQPIGGGGFVVSAVQSVASAGSINSSTTDQRQMRLVQGNAAPVTTSSTPFGNTGGWKDGTEIALIGADDTNTVSIVFNDASKGIIGNFSSIEIFKGKIVECIWSSSLDRWIVKGNP